MKRDMKVEVVVDPQTSHSLERLSRNHFQDETKIDLSAAGMLSQLHSIAGMLLQEVHISDRPVEKRLQMAKDLAKLIPLLAHAERKVHKGWRGKDVEDMTDKELMRARRALKVVKQPR